MKVLITGGAGYIGSHSAIEFLENGHEVILYDNFCGDTMSNIFRIKSITKKDFKLIVGDIRDTVTLANALQGVDVVLHLAALKVAGESEKKPLDYYDINVAGLLSVIKAMMLARVEKIVFASSAHIYGSKTAEPISEDRLLFSDNVYGRTKKDDEEILSRMSQEGIDVVALRYFNIAGAHSSGKLGDQMMPPKNVFAKLALCADGKGDFKITNEELKYVGKKYIKDYVHIEDIAKVNRLAVEFINDRDGYFTFNVGSGYGTSIMEFIKLFEDVSGKVFHYTLIDGEPFDPESTIANTSYTFSNLKWKAEKTPKNIVEDIWKWYKKEYC